ncbi:Uncharacterised protein [Aedoeadaptatus ivorii]|uniref:Uncharacterized protein n=1 Tax=Aedoeadaptatus ivorii TaxID=54006 RepID=A0A448V2S3_9FIRM|nr:hypothetical protein [Peptoniphilus ivorii]VEJ36091.1 Uncharacterised protein [Peptoniphilus ivorii]
MHYVNQIRVTGKGWLQSHFFIEFISIFEEVPYGRSRNFGMHRVQTKKLRNV